MRATFTIPGRFIGLNEFIKANRASYYKGASAKKDETERVCTEAIAQHVPHFDKPVRIECVWYERNRRRDIDNIISARKFIHDGLVRAGVIEDDSQRFVVETLDHMTIDRKNPRVVVTITDEV